MSLLTGITYKDQFVIVTNDSKVTLGYYTPGRKFDKDNVKETDIKKDKVSHLTDKVLISITGFELASDFILGEFRKMVKPENDLTECAEILNELMLELVDSNNDEKDYVDFVTRSYSLNLFGFNHNGATGIAEYNGITQKVDLLESPLDINKYPIIMQSPDPINDRKNMYPYLTLPAEHQTFNTFVNQLITVHAHLSATHKKNISTDCHFHVLVNNEGFIKHSTFIVETLDFYKELGLLKK